MNNKKVFAGGFAVLAFVFVGAGCATENGEEEEQVAESTSDLTRGASGSECNQGDGLYCGGHGVFGNARALFRCSDRRISLVGWCSDYCRRMPDGQNDQCPSSIGGGDGPAQSVCPSGDGYYCGGNGISGGKNLLYSCFGGAIKLVANCGAGCAAMPPGYNDHCK